MRRRAGAVAVALALIGAGCSHEPAAVPFGFTDTSGAGQQALERQVVARVDPVRLRDLHRELTRLPHPAGSPRDRELAAWVAQQFAAAGLEDIRTTTHEVMLPQPLEVRVEMSGPQPWRARDREPGTDAAGIASHAFSASGAVTAPVVYAGPGTPADYAWLARQGIDIRGRIALVHTTDVYRYRGLAAFTAQQHGAAGLLVFPDLIGDTPGGTARDDEAARIERGSILYDFFYPGDPLTPGWASVPGARRIAPAEAASIPSIVSAPISADDARVVLKTMTGPHAPEWWGRGLSRDARVGPGRNLRIEVRADAGTRPIWTVTAMIRSTEAPDDVVIVGNHRDAWVFGGVDPSTGTAAMLELARVLGALAREGWRPKRTLLFASWDAEEFGLTSSTEWVEQHEAWLRERAVAYLNVDSAASGSHFSAGASPSLTGLVAAAADAVRYPSSGAMSVAAATRARSANDRGTVPRGTDDEVVADRLGGGSDYVPFLTHVGVPSVDVAFDGPYRTYHSAFDTHGFVERQADPGFLFTAALARILGVAALRLVNAEVIPIDPSTLADASRRYLRELDARISKREGDIDFRDLRAALDEFGAAAQRFDERRRTALNGNSHEFADLNRRLLVLERAFLDDAGLPGRVWYRHTLVAPSPSYDPQILPGLSDALDADDRAAATQQAGRLAAAFRRASAVLDGR